MPERQEALHGEFELGLIALCLSLKVPILDEFLHLLLRLDHIGGDLCLGLRKLTLKLVDHLLFPAVYRQHRLPIYVLRVAQIGTLTHVGRPAESAAEPAA